MGTPTKESIKEAIDALSQPNNASTWNSKFKSINEEKRFNDLIAELNTYWEKKNKQDSVTSTDDKLFLAKAIKHHYGNNPGKFSFANPAKIGPFLVKDLLPLALAQNAAPYYTDLKDSWQANKPEFKDVRADVARVLGIADKGHAHHGSNFSGTQTLEQIIKNLWDKVQGESELTRVSGLIKTKYKLDI